MKDLEKLFSRDLELYAGIFAQKFPTDPEVAKAEARLKGVANNEPTFEDPNMQNIANMLPKKGQN